MSGEELRGAPAEARAGDYVFLGFVTLLNVLNFVDRQLLASFANFIVPDLKLTNAEFGLLTGFAFIVFYAAMGLFMGVLADRLHRPRLIAAGLALWSVLTAASGAARGFVSLAIPRMLIGVGESALSPSAISMLADRFPAGRLGFASGVYYMGVPIGVGVSLLVAGYLGPAIGWRNCFYVLGAVGIALALAMVFVPETERRRARSERLRSRSGGIETSVTLRGSVAVLGRALATSPALSLTIAGGVALHFILGAAAFEQLWFVQERGFERGEIARLTGYIGIVAGILGNLVGGAGSDWFQKRTGAGRPVFLVIVMLATTPFTLAYRLVPPDSFWFVLGIFLGYFQLGTFYGPTFSTVQELVPPQIRATVIAFYILMLNLVGLGVGITLGGYTIDWLIAGGVEAPYTWTLFGFGILSAVSIPLFYFAGRRYALDRARLFAAESPS
ncbi:MAG: MFS transporter [Alphaproteobacteria bacterium]|nr:MFS transporter [Alphaproteobacteria bacterium]